MNQSEQLDPQGAHQDKPGMVRPILFGACIAIALVTAISAIGFFI